VLVADRLGDDPLADAGLTRGTWPVGTSSSSSERA
jgi:hypothetical protein